MTPLRKAWARLFYWPSIGVHRLMCLARIWRRWDWINESLLLGGAPTRREARALADAGISAAVCLCEPYEMGRSAIEAAGIECLTLPVIDYTRPGADAITRGAAFIGERIEAGGKVFVFCKAGRVRSAAVMMGYLMTMRQLTPTRAFELIRKSRPQVNARLDRDPVLLAIAKSSGSRHGDSGSGAS